MKKKENSRVQKKIISFGDLFLLYLTIFGTIFSFVFTWFVMVHMLFSELPFSWVVFGLILVVLLLCYGGLTFAISIVLIKTRR